MKLTLLKPFLGVLISIFFITPNSNCQNLTGIWRGRFITENGDEYKYELQIDQSKTNHLTGVSYSYLDTRFYGKAILTGNFIKNASSALIQELKTVELKMSGGSMACIMKCLFTYATSGKEEFLEGTFTSTYEKTDPLSQIKKGGDCGGGKVFLRKVTTSDFYEEPFLKNNKTVEKNDSSLVKSIPPLRKVPPSIKTFNQPKAHIANSKLPTSKSIAKSNKLPKKVLKDIKKDSIEHHRTTGAVTVEKSFEIPKISIPVTTRSRENELIQTLTVNSEEVIVRLYDNGEVDDDTVSVYMDGKPLAMNKRLSTVPIILSIKMDEESPEHTLVMYAENMGRIPPNTSLMIVQDGDKRYQVSIVSTEQKNAMVRFRYKKKEQ
ncbi:MAG: hypothetical protein ACJ748_00365 [Flavisolibacter sp.]